MLQINLNALNINIKHSIFHSSVSLNIQGLNVLDFNNVQKDFLISSRTPRVSPDLYKFHLLHSDQRVFERNLTLLCNSDNINDNNNNNNDSNNDNNNNSNNNDNNNNNNNSCYAYYHIYYFHNY